MKLFDIMLAMILMVLWVEASLPVTFSLGIVAQQLIKRIEQAKFPLQTCDILIMDNFISELEFNKDVPVITFNYDIDSDQTLPAFQTFLANHLKCLIVFARYTGKETIQFMDKLLEKKPNSLLVLIGSRKMESDSTKRWKPIVYMRQRALMENYKSNFEQFVSLETKCPNSMYFTFDVWNSDSGFSHPDSNPFANCKHPFEGRFFMFSAVAFQPNFLWRPGKPPIGTDLLILKILSDKFNFKYAWKFVESLSKVYDDVANGTSLMLIGGAPLTFEIISHVGYTIPTYIFHAVFVAYKPQPLSSINNMLQAFDPLVWSLSYFSLLAISALLGLIYYVYQYKLENRHGLVKPIFSAFLWVDFIILPFSRCLKPEPITWFPKRTSSGMLLVQFWSFFTMFLVFFYTSNLQADLVRKTYEKPLNTLQDVLDRDKPVYIPTVLAAFDYKAAKAQGIPISDIMVKISKLAYKTNGYYDIVKSKGHIPHYMTENIKNIGATYLTTDATSIYAFLGNGGNINLGLPYIQTAKETLASQMMCFFEKKYSPWKEDVDWTLIRMIDSGIMQKILYDPIPIAATIKWTPTMETVDNEPLKMNQLLLAFILMGAIYLFSFIIFICELTYKKWKNWYQELRQSTPNVRLRKMLKNWYLFLAHENVAKYLSRRAAVQNINEIES